MPQDRESGARANKYGRETAKRIAEKIGATSISTTSNEFLLKNKKITIRCARKKTSDVGVSYKMLERIDTIMAALEQEDGRYELYEVSPLSFKLVMRDSNNEGKVGLVRKSIFMNKGKLFSTVKL